MAICKQCGVEIPEGQEFCENCIKSQSNTPNTDESYLDNLLQSISLPQEKENLESLQDYTEEQNDLQKNELLGNSTLEDINLEELENNVLEDINLEELENNIAEDINLGELGNDALRDINLEELENDALEDINLEKAGSTALEDTSLEETENTTLEDIGLENLQDSASENIDLEEVENKALEDTDLNELDVGNSGELDMEALDNVNLDSQNETLIEQLGNIPPEEVENAAADSQNLENLQENDSKGSGQELDDVVGSLLNDLDSSGGVSFSESEENDTADISDKDINLDEIEPNVQNETDPMGDVEDLLGMLASEAMEEGESKSSDTEDANEEEVKEDIFSLDNIGDIENLLGEATEEETLAKEIKSVEGTEEGNKRKIFEELEDNGDSLESNILEDLPSQKELEKKKGIIQKLFGNIFDDKSKKSHKKMEEKEEKSLQNKEKKKEKKEAKKAAKNDPAVIAEKEAKKKAKEDKKAAAKAVKAEKKKEKDEKKKQRLAEEEEEAKKDQGRINPIGAAIIFILAGAATVFVVFGSKSFSYSKSIKEAEKYFTGRDYNLAYDEVRGLDIKDKDLETYDKIITVMYVNKQLNSYDNYYSMKMYPQALDSLLKGLKKYDEYIGSAKKLGVKNDFEYLKKRILKEMKKIFKLSESQAYKIIDSNDQEIYSQKVVEVADKNKEE